MTRQRRGEVSAVNEYFQVGGHCNHGNGATHLDPN